MSDKILCLTSVGNEQKKKATLKLLKSARITTYYDEQFTLLSFKNLIVFFNNVKFNLYISPTKTNYF